MLNPEEVGLSTDGVVLGKHSDRNALATRAKSLGFLLEGDELDLAFAAFKDAVDELGSVDTARLLAILSGPESGRREKLWRVGRIDIRAPVSTAARSVARVELEHGKRGRVTEIASARGGLDAVFSAVGQIIGVDARVRTLEMRYAAANPAGSTEDAAHNSVLVEISIEVDGEIFLGRARECDVLPCCVAAFIDAASDAAAVRRVQAAKVGREPNASSGTRL